MEITLINKLYDLINNNYSKTTLITNLELFKQFYDNHYLIKYQRAFMLNKIFSIVKFLLIYEEEELDPYFRSTMISYYIDLIGRRCNDLYLKDKETNEEVLSALVELGSECYQLRNLFKDEYISKLNDIDKSDVKRIFDLDIDRFFIVAFIQLLYKGYFELNIDNIKIILWYLENNDFINKLIDGKIEITPTVRDFIYQYIDKYLKVRDFSINTNIKDNKLLKAILSGKIKDLKLLYVVIDTLDIEILLAVCDNNIDNIISLIDSLEINQYSKLELFKEFSSKDLSDETTALLFTKYYIKHPNSHYFNHCFMKAEINLLFQYSLNSSIDLLDKDYIEYIINNKLYKHNVTFLLNLYKYYQKDHNIIPDSLKSNFDSLVSKYHLNMLEDINLEKSKNYLRDYLVHNKKLNVYRLISIATAFTRYITGIPDYPVYFYMSNRDTGSYDNEAKNIKYDFCTIKELLTSTNIETRRKLMFDFLNTICHECTHMLQYQKMENESNYDKDTLDFIKEELILSNYPEYYTNNYLDINIEQDARKKGLDLFMKIIIDVCPEVIEPAKKYYIEHMAKEKEKFEQNKKAFGASDAVSYDIIFERLIKLKSQIINEYPMLQEMYNVDGNLKDRSCHK